jgi:hypothetical protein
MNWAIRIVTFPAHVVNSAPWRAAWLGWHFKHRHYDDPRFAHRWQRYGSLEPRRKDFGV